MITLTEIEIAVPAQLRLDAKSGSVLHGALIEHLDDTLATALHVPSLRPYSQHLRVNRESVRWRIGTLTPLAAEKLLEPLAAENHEFYLRDKAAAIRLAGRQRLVHCTYRDFAHHFFAAAEPTRRIVVSFVTPTSFKVDSSYQIFPSVFHLFQSLVNRWNACAGDFNLERPGLAEDLAAYTRISDYRLRLAPFSIEGNRIPAFVGELTLTLAGAEPLTRLACMLLAYAEVCGIGIKTALGMGGVTVQAKPKGAAILVHLLPQAL